MRVLSEKQIDFGTDIRPYRGKRREVKRFVADYQEEEDGSLTFLGYKPYRIYTEFTTEVNKCAVHALDFGHAYFVKRQLNEKARGTTEEYGYEELFEGNSAPQYVENGKISVRKAGLKGYHLNGDEDLLIEPKEYFEYVGSLYKEYQSILKKILGVSDSNMPKGERGAYNTDIETARNGTTIRGRVIAFTGAESDYAEVDLVTETELLLVSIFDEIDNTSCDDSVKFDLVKYAAEKVAMKRLGKSSSDIARRSTPRGSGKLKRRRNPSRMAKRLLNDLPNYTISLVEDNPKEIKREGEYLDSIDELKAAIRNRDDDRYVPAEAGRVERQLRRAKKRGDGYTAFSKMQKKYATEHELD